MRLQEVGGIASSDAKYLDHEWYRQLSSEQLDAYIRYLFIALKENAYDVDSPAQRMRRHNWDGGKDYFNTKRKKVWSQISATIRRYDAVPGTWVAAHLSPVFHAVRIAENKGFVDNRPELLHNPLSIDVYRQHIEVFDEITTERAAAAEFSVATQMNLLQTVIKDPDDLILYVSADKTNVNATPFFRHAFAAEAECERAVNKYIMQAAVEYDMNQKLYDALAEKPENAGWISPRLLATTAANRKYWSTYHG
jgi:hypothetical protein